MKKLFALLAVALGVVACQKDQADMGVNLGGEQEVMINVSLPDETRADSADGFDLDSLKTDANYQLRYILEIYRDGAEDGKKYRDVKYSDDTSVSFPVRLAPGRAYSIAVWADVVEQVENAPGLYYNAESLKNISINESYWTAMDEKRDAFYGKASLGTNDHVADMNTIALKRPFAKIRVISTDIDAVRNFDLDPTNVSVEYLSELYTSFDAVSGKAVGAKTSNKVVTANYDTAKYDDFNTAEATLFADYIFVPEDGTIQFAMKVFAGTSEINDTSFTTPIPVEVNKVTTIKGDVLTEGGNVSVKIENELGEKETINMVNTAESLQEIINNTQVGESANIALGGDIDLDDLLGAGILSTRAAANAGLVIPEGKSVVLDLNGFTISQSKACDASYSMITNNGNLTILGGGIVEFTNTAEGGGSTWGTYTIENRGEGVLTIDNATIRHNGCVNGEINHDTNIAIQNYQGKVVVNNGTIASTQFRSLRDFTAGGEIIINGGTFLGQVWMQGLDNGSSSLTINGGSFSPVEGYDGSSVYITNNTNVVNVAITGGMFNTKVGCFDANKEGAKGCIVGGNFTATAKEKTAAALFNDDYAWVEAENGLWTLDRKADVAKIGEVGYTSLAKAVAAVKDGETITLVSDITLENIAVLADRENVVLDGNGKTLTSSAGRAINVSGAQNVTIKDLTINASGERAINIIQNSTNITIENVTATAANYTVNVASSAPGAVVAIKNSTLNGLCTVNVSSAEANVTVDNSTVNCNDNNTTKGESYAALCLIKEAVRGKIIATNSTINVTEGSDSTAGRNGAEDGVVTINGSVEGVVVTYAVITYTGSDYYYGFQTIAEAVEFAKSGDTISLIRNVELTEILTIPEGKNVILDGNGKTLTSSAGRAINISGAENVTIKNLNIVASGERAINVIQNSKNVTIENVTATAANYTVNVASSAPSAVVAIKNSTLNGLCTVNVASAGAKVTVDNSTVNCNDNNTTEGESYAALCLNKDAVGGEIIATNSTINVTEGSDSTAGRNGAEGGVVTINGSVEGVVVMNAVITFPNSDNYYSFETIAEAVEFAKNGDVISLIRDVELAETLVIAEGKNIVLDLNGKTLAAVDKNTIKNNGGNLTLKNGTVTRTGDVVGYSVNNASGEISVVDATVERGLYTSGSKMTATNANISHEQSSRHAIYAWNCEVTINSGTFHNDNAGNATLMASGSSVVTINGGTFSIADGRSTIGWTSSMIDQNSTAQVIVKGGLFNGGFRINSADTTLTIEGGEFNTNNGSAFTDYSGTKVVKGGKFTDTGAQNWAKKYIAEGYEMNANGEVVAK